MRRSVDLCSLADAETEVLGGVGRAVRNGRPYPIHVAF